MREKEMGTRPRRLEVSDATLTVLVFPGSSLMKLTLLAPGMVLVRCPGCGATQMFSTTAVPEAFVHEDGDCPVLRRIGAALRSLEIVRSATDSVPM